MIESFLSRPIDLACVRDKSLGAHTTGLGTRMSTSTSGGATHVIEPTARTTHARQRALTVHYVVHCLSYHSWTPLMETIHKHCL